MHSISFSMHTDPDKRTKVVVTAVSSFAYFLNKIKKKTQNQEEKIECECAKIICEIIEIALIYITLKGETIST